MRQTEVVQANLLADIGDGGFNFQEFELQQELGRLSWVCAASDCVQGLPGPPPGLEGYCIVKCRSRRTQKPIRCRWGAHAPHSRQPSLPTWLGTSVASRSRCAIPMTFRGKNITIHMVLAASPAQPALQANASAGFAK